MKVSDAMSTQVDSVNKSTSIKDVCRLIFGRGVNGVPVVENKKIVGFITEKDVISRLFPSLQEYIEDPVNTIDFEKMEEKSSEIFRLPAEKIMSKNLITVSPETPLLRAQSLMSTEKIGRLPVIDEKGNLVGILSKGDIFKAVIGENLPTVSDEEYHDWVSRQYDLVIGWENRLSNEIPDLTSLFKKLKVKRILDVGCGTGEHDISLVQKGFNVLGIEKSKLMYSKAEEKKNKLSSNVRKNLDFAAGDYYTILSNKRNDFDAAIFMGNALAQNLDWRQLLKATVKNLKTGNSAIVLQITNFEKILKTNKRLQDFNIKTSKKGQNNELAFIEFFDPPTKKGEVTFNMTILEFGGKRWTPKAINNTTVALINKKDIERELRKLGFKKIYFYGSKDWGSIFKDKFNPLQSDRLNVIAVR